MHLFLKLKYKLKNKIMISETLSITKIKQKHKLKNKITIGETLSIKPKYNN